ncbi:hypothetical protein ACIBCN_28350 [Nocardia sp. NPDC051052]|uniref:hypothetical protein n=1 Tax=Nocardia sp. NPDC051052 TaxID=3364322 RepID=UPI00378D831A
MYLVAGPTRIIGRSPVEALLAQGAELRVVTRDPANRALPAGVEAVAPEAIRPALKNADGLFVHPRATGRPARTFATWVADRAQAWS